jgi:hypothetical protein
VPSLALAAAALLAVSEPEGWIISDTTPTERSQQVDLTSSFDPAWLGASVWYSWPFLPQGLIPPVNDSLSIEAGGHVMLFFSRHDRDTLLGLMPLIGPRWSFHLTPTWTLFWTLKLGYELLLGNRYGWAGDGSLGAYWHMSESVFLRVEMGTHGLLRVGLSVPLGG